MLGKLFKYDFKWINKIMMYYYIFTIAISVVTRILSNFRDTFIQNLVYGIFRGILIGCFINIVINYSLITNLYKYNITNGIMNYSIVNEEGN